MPKENAESQKLSSEVSPSKFTPEEKKTLDKMKASFVEGLNEAAIKEGGKEE